jgi:hypothetical protein
MWGACGRQQLFSKKLAIQRPVRTPAIRVTRADRTDNLHGFYQSTPSPVDFPLASMPGDVRQRLETHLAKVRIKCEGLAASDSQHDGKAQAVD